MQTMRMPQVLLALAVLAAASSARAGSPPAAGTGGVMVELSGRRVYVEATGSPTAPPLLYLHGGPGMGAYDFALAQSTALSPHVRLVLMDQRGCLRSDSLEETESFLLADLIADIEALRRYLGVERWSVLGHSFGGYLAVQYALEHPASVERLLLESPTLDMASSARSVLRGAAVEYRNLRQPEQAKRCLDAAEARLAPREAWEVFGQLTRGLGPHRNNLYVHGPEKDFFDRLVAESGIPPESWARHQLFQKKLYAEGKVFESLLPRLGSLDCPVLLLRGRHDLVVADDQVEALLEAQPSAKVVTFEASSHFPHHEEAPLFSETVVEFLASPGPVGP